MIEYSWIKMYIGSIFGVVKSALGYSVQSQSCDRSLSHCECLEYPASLFDRLALYRLALRLSYEPRDHWSVPIVNLSGSKTNFHATNGLTL